MKLTLVGHELFAPATTCARAEPDLNAIVDVAGEQVAVVGAITWRCALERWCFTASLGAENRFEYYSLVVLGHADHLMAWHKREAY